MQWRLTLITLVILCCQATMVNADNWGWRRPMYGPWGGHYGPMYRPYYRPWFQPGFMNDGLYWPNNFGGPMYYGPRYLF